MQNRLTTLLVVCGALVFGARASFARTSNCFKKEINPLTGHYYQSQEVWQADVNALDASFPPLPNLFLLRVGYKVGVTESKVAEHMRPDKRQHCYVGCRITNEANYDVADYAAYYKEWHDLRDCDPETEFDPKDINATLYGATMAVKNPSHADRPYCLAVCTKKYR